MRRLIVYISIIFIAVIIGLTVVYDPGYILLYFHHWTVEMPFWLGCLLLIVTIWIVHFIWRMSYHLFHAHGRVHAWRHRRHLRQTHSKTSDGLLALLRGQWGKAEQLLLQGAKKSHTPAVNYLFAAKAAQKNGAIKQRDRHLKMAIKAEPKEKLAALLTQADLQMAKKEFEPAKQTLEKIKALDKNNPLLKKLQDKLTTQLKTWDK